MPEKNDAPLFPEDSVLRRIDDDLALAERRALRDWALPDEIDRLMILREEHEERTADQAAKAQGRPRRRRQVTSGLGFNAYRRGGPLPLWERVLWVILAVASMVYGVLGLFRGR